LDEDPQQTILIIQDIVSNGIDLNLFLASISMLFLLFCSAMISGSEVAFFSLDASKWEDEKDSTSEAQIKKMLHKPNHLLATILISNNFINVAIIILSTYMTDSLLDYNQYPILGFIIQVVCFIASWRGYPKSICQSKNTNICQKNERTAYNTKRTIQTFESIASFININY
jgi:Mg2+/Co2+ transporter CorB